MKHREFWIDERQHDSLQSVFTTPTEDCIHVIEYSDYSQAIYELDKSRIDHVKKINELTDELEILKSKASQFESTIKATIAEKEKLKSDYELLEVHSKVVIELLENENKIMRESIILSAEYYFDRQDGKHDSIACSTCDMGGSGRSTRKDQHDDYCSTAIAYDTLKKCNTAKDEK